MKEKMTSKFILSGFLLLLSVIGLTIILLKPKALENLNQLMFYHAAVTCPGSCTYGCTETPSANNGLCDKLAEIVNVIGDVDCSLVATTNFNTATPNLVAANGLRFFNFGSDADGDGMYTIYVDIDGPKRNGILNEDVIAFNVYQDGNLVPAFDSAGANNIRYLSASVKYVDSGGATVRPLNGVSYREALCKAGQGPNVAYCTGFTALTECTSGVNACEVVINKPKFMK